MTKLIIEDREFKDRNTGIVTNYKYYAISGGDEKKTFEIPLKMLTGAEKSGLEMINYLENPEGLTTETRKATDSEKEAFLNSVQDADESDFLND